MHEPIQLHNALNDLAAEITRTRSKFPINRMLVEALAEELGEAARQESPGNPGGEEWLHVACVAMRLYTEGTDEGAGTVLALFEAAELVARRDLDNFAAELQDTHEEDADRG